MHDTPRLPRMPRPCRSRVNGRPATVSRAALRVARRHAARRSSASPAPRSAATPATAAPAPCCSTASRSAPAWCHRRRSTARAVDTVEGAGRRHRRPAARGVPRPRRGAMRHLHARHADGRRPTARAPSGAEPQRGRGRARRRAVPLHRLPQDRRGDARCRAVGLPPSPRSSRGVARPARAVGARVCRGSTAGQRSPAPTGSAPTRRPPMRSGCAWCARRMRARGSRSATSTPSVAHIPGLAAILTAADVPARTPSASSRHEGPAGAGARHRALSRRGGAGAGRHARGGRRRSATPSCRSPGQPQPPLAGIDGGAGAGRAGAARRRARQRADARPPEVRRRRRRLMRARPPRPRAASRPRFVEHAYIEPEAGYAVPRRGRPHRGHGLHPGALHGPRGDGARAGRRARRACASAPAPAAAASAASSTCRCSRCWRWRRG